MDGLRAWTVVVVTMGLSVPTAALAQPVPTTQPNQHPTPDIAGLIAVLDEPPSANRTAQVYRKRSACERISATTPDGARAIPSLVRLLHDQQLGGWAAMAMSQLGEPASAATLAAARDDDPICRRFAIQAMSSLPLPVVEPVLVDMSRHDPDGTVVLFATEALCERHPLAASPVLEHQLHYGNTYVRLELLRRISAGPLTDGAALELGEQVNGQDPQVIEAAKIALIRTHANTMPLGMSLSSTASRAEGLPGEAAAMQVLRSYPGFLYDRVQIATLGLRSPLDSTRATAIQIIDEAKPDAVGPHLHDLTVAIQYQRSGSGTDEVLRAFKRACDAYVATGPVEGSAADRTLKAVIAVLDDKHAHPDAKEAVQRLLVRFGPRAKVAIPQMAAILSGTTYGGDRVAAAECLTSLAPAGAVADSAAIDAITDGSEPVRLAAERYLLAEPAAAGPLLADLFDNATPAVRLTAIHLATRLPGPDPDVVRRVSKLTADPVPNIRLEAWSLLNSWTHGPTAAPVIAILKVHPPATAAATTDLTPNLRSEAQSVAAAIGLEFVIPPPPTPKPPAEARAEPEAGRSNNLSTHLSVGVVVTLLLIGVLAVVTIVQVIRHLAWAMSKPPADGDPARQHRTPAMGAVVRNCTRCRAIVPTTSRYCRRCGLENPTALAAAPVRA